MPGVLPSTCSKTAALDGNLCFIEIIPIGFGEPFKSIQKVP